jgi:sarcosine oxidase subunit alpha
MSSQTYRINNESGVSSKKLVQFTFDNQTYYGYEGDTLAASLLANGVKLVGRSFKYHRARGTLTAGIEEPHALVQLEPASAHTEANRRATEVEIYEGLNAESQNCWPNVKYDIGMATQLFAPLLSAGFYYKTFKQPQKLWPWYEKQIRKAAGLGKSPQIADPDRYERQYAHCDVLIIGGGFAGMSVARQLAQSDKQVILCEQSHLWGGTLNNEAKSHSEITLNDEIPENWINGQIEHLANHNNITLLKRTTAFGHYSDNYVCLVERITEHLPINQRQKPRQRLWQVRADSVVHATGQIERPLLFPYNDRPGIMLAQSVRHYINYYRVKPGRQAVVLTNNDQAYQCALDLHNNDVEVKAIVDVRSKASEYWYSRVKNLGIEIKNNAEIRATYGFNHLKKVHVFNESINEFIECDLLAVSGGFNPTVNLWSHAEGEVVYDENYGSYVTGRAFQPNQYACGGCKGSLSYEKALKQSQQVIQSIMGSGSETSFSQHELNIAEPAFDTPSHYWCLVNPYDFKKAKKTFVDTATDVTVYDIKQAIEEGFSNVQHVKRYTTCGMGPDQGKTANVNLFHLIAKLTDQSEASVGTTTYRPAYTPVTFGAIAGFDQGVNAMAPNRYTPMHSWHVKNNAVFENVGNWWRARYYKQHPGETLRQAISRESWATRNKAGILDGTTLGKVDIQGKDAAKFLNYVYTNKWDTLKVGRCRYGVMVGEDGMIMDDGVTARLDENHFHMTTTSGGAPKVMAWLEQWLQTEWPDMDVYLTSVTEQWAVLSLSGPKSADIVKNLLVDSDIDVDEIKPLRLQTGKMSWNEYRDIPVRVFGIAFSGEDGYEINIPSRYGLSLWEKVLQIGYPYGLTVYGTETMHLLRAEKGFIIVGQETDGTITPYDADMPWVVSKKKDDFIGKRSLFRTDTQRDDRKHLVGLLPEDKEHVLEEGANIIATSELPSPPVPIIGHVTSSYYSPNLGRSFALAFLKQGKSYPQETVYVAYPEQNTTKAVKVVDKQFL